jgi:hypothetical protein
VLRSYIPPIIMNKTLWSNPSWDEGALAVRQTNSRDAMQSSRRLILTVVFSFIRTIDLFVEGNARIDIGHKTRRERRVGMPNRSQRRECRKRFFVYINQSNEGNQGNQVPAASAHARETTFGARHNDEHLLGSCSKLR